MLIIRNNVIPFTGYKAMFFFGILFVRGEAVIDEVTMNHERIHARQLWEIIFAFLPFWILMTFIISPWILLFAPWSFYLWYVIEWLIRGLLKITKIDKSSISAYRSLLFEREAYANQNNMEYLTSRKLFAFLRRSKNH